MRAMDSHMGRCHLTSWMQTKECNTPKKGLTPGCIYIICLDSTPKDSRSPLSVTFLVGGVVRNDLIWFTKFRQQKETEYFVLEYKYQLFVEGGHYISCVVKIGDEVWISEKSLMRIHHDKNRLCFTSEKKGNCLEGYTELSTIDIVQDLFRKYGVVDSTQHLFVNTERKKQKIGRPVKQKTPPVPKIPVYIDLCRTSTHDHETTTSTQVPICDDAHEVSSQVDSPTQVPICSSQSDSSTLIPICDDAHEVSSQSDSSTRCENERTKFFSANFEDEEGSGMTYAQSFYLFKFRRLMNQISKTRITLSAGQISRLTSLGYIPDFSNDGLYTFTYVTGCVCGHFVSVPIEKQTATMMISFVFPIEDSELYQELIEMWSYFDIFRHPLLNYQSIIHLSPSLEDNKHGYTVFNISVCFFRKSVPGLQKSKIIQTLVRNIDIILRWYEGNPEITSVSAFNEWVDQNP